MEVVEGNPDEAHVSTSYVERQNLTMRMSMRRFTRLTNAFSKRLEYRPPRWRCTSCITTSAGFTRRCALPRQWKRALRILWEIGDIVDMVEADAPKPNRPATYEKHGLISN